MKFLIKAVFKVVKLMINLILLPLDLIIDGFLPELDTIIQYVNSFFTWLFDFIVWVLSWLPFSQTFYAILGAVLIFKFMVPFSAHTIKLVLKWYRTLVP